LPPEQVVTGSILGNVWWKEWSGKHGKDIIITHLPVPRNAITDRAVIDNFNLPPWMSEEISKEIKRIGQLELVAGACRQITLIETIDRYGGDSPLVRSSS
jgi:hypothetical protein